jgi:hypothetical protein
VSGHDGMEGNIHEENGTNTIRLKTGNKELAGSGRCPEKDSTA